MRKRGKGRKVESGAKMKEQTLQNEGDGLRRETSPGNKRRDS